MAREAARDAALSPTPEPEPEPIEVTPAPEPVSEPSRRLLAARRRHQDRADPHPVPGSTPPEASRNARALAAVVVAIAVLGFGIVILIAALAATP